MTQQVHGKTVGDQVLQGPPSCRQQQQMDADHRKTQRMQQPAKAAADRIRDAGNRPRPALIHLHSATPLLQRYMGEATAKAGPDELSET